ncbi:MAG TPA: class I SAM-dependent methyltransferase [Gaiellaceae bacterium]|nr:class I SAM-dependent methyltransferase [Gaiellaceae bacterium]
MTDGGSSIPAVRALLRVLAQGRDCAELGTAFGEGAAALAETAGSVVTVERDPERAARARLRLADLPNVEVLEGDCYELLRGRGPFGLVFADGGRPYRWDAIVDLLAPGGFVVKDDLTPGRPVEGDQVREALLRNPRLAAVEILTTPETAAIVAVRR